MRGFGLVLKAVLAVSITLAVFAIVGGLDWLAEREASMRINPEPIMDVAEHTAPPMSAPSVAPPDPALEPSSSGFAQPPETSLAQATAIPEDRSASTITRSDLPPLT